MQKSSNTIYMFFIFFIKTFTNPSFSYLFVFLYVKLNKLHEENSFDCR